MPAGTLGFRGEGELTDEDLRERTAPAVAEATALGGVRMLLVTPSGFGTNEIPAVADLVRKQPSSHLGHSTDWQGVAVVTDNGMLRRSARVWTRMVPVPIKVFAPDEESKARAWLLDS